MKIKVLPRAECFAAAHGWGIEYGIEDFNIPTLIISISSYDTPIPNALAIDAEKKPDMLLNSRDGFNCVGLIQSYSIA